MDPKKEAKELIENLTQRMGPSPYDMAWLASLRTSSDGDVRWPDAVEWLLDHQHRDGSWGGEIEYYHDRIICTLAAATALYENGYRLHAQNAIQRAERYLWSHLHLLPRDPFELVGFELILPTLIAQAKDKGLAVPPHACGYEKIQTAKLRLIPPDMIYSPQVTIVHDLEYLGRSADRQLIAQALASNGSLGNSPATTAYYLSMCPDDDRSSAYIEMVWEQLGYVNTLYPFRTFELIWVLNNLSFCLSPVTDFADDSIWHGLRAEMGSEGIGLDPSFGIPDGDCTSVCCRLLMDAGCDIDPQILGRFEDNRTHTFRTYHYERNISTGTNVHALQALNRMPDYPECRKVQQQILLLLLDHRRFNMYWVDKWHTSPYYATAHVLIGLLEEGTYMASACRDSADWLMHTQREDGSWGFFSRGTAEETAYALTALLHYSRYLSVDPDVLHRGADYLLQQHQSCSLTFPELWIGKCLFVPHDIVRSAILAAIILYEEIVGRHT